MYQVVVILLSSLTNTNKMNKLKNYSIGLEPEAHEALQAIKAKSGASIQWQIREAINAYIKQQNEGGQNASA